MKKKTNKNQKKKWKKKINTTRLCLLSFTCFSHNRRDSLKSLCVSITQLKQTKHLTNPTNHLFIHSLICTCICQPYL